MESMRALVFASAIGAMFACEARAAGGAFVVDDAAVDEPGACKVESSLSFGSNRDFIGLSTPACVVPFFKPVELGVNIVRTRQDGEWGTALIPKAKMNILPVETGKLGLAIATGSAFNVLTGEYTGSFVNVPVTYTFSETFKVNFNGGWTLRAISRPALPQLRRRRWKWIPMKPFT
jgi:hypothetical protein